MKLIKSIFLATLLSLPLFCSCGDNEEPIKNNMSPKKQIENEFNSLEYLVKQKPPLSNLERKAASE